MNNEYFKITRAHTRMQYGSGQTRGRPMLKILTSCEWAMMAPEIIFNKYKLLLNSKLGPK
jgi:hypothetical protein